MYLGTAVLYMPCCTFTRARRR
eukprot:SAG31_NODE_33148_length_347_cov_0.822581_1_plen_21_part_10